MKIEAGNTVVIVLQNPREKIFGIIDEISDAGVIVRGIDLNYFDEWIAAINGNEPTFPMQDSFFPMWRVERISLDAGTEGMPSMGEQFEQRTGKQVGEF